MISATRKVRIVRRSDKTRAVVAGAEAVEPTGRVPRISRLMALAIHFDRLLREGKVRDQSEVARLVHVTQPRMTQIMNLNLLAPDLQEQLLSPQSLTSGRPVTTSERHLRSIVAVPAWTEQRRRWAHLRFSAAGC